MLLPPNNLLPISLSSVFRLHQSRLSVLRPAYRALRSMAMYDNKIFASSSNTSNGEVDARTRFHYHQAGNIVWAEYAGGSIVRGSLIATVQNDKSSGVEGKLDMRYQHVNTDGDLMTGRCVSTPEILEDGRLRLHERWTWTSGDCSSGESVVEEVSKL